MENDIAGTMVNVGLIAVAVILGGFWNLLPLLLLNKLNKLIKTIEDSDSLLNVITNHTKPEGAVSGE